MMQSAVSRIGKSAAVGLLSTTLAACFASTAQLDEVRDDVSATRAEAATSDSVRAVQLVQILATLRDVTDSISSLNQRMTRLRAETQADVRGMRQEVNQILEVTGQSETRLKELRAQIDSKMRRVPPPPAPTAPPIDTVQTVTVSPAAAP